MIKLLSDFNQHVIKSNCRCLEDLDMQEINLIVDGIVAVVKIETSENHLEAIVSRILF